MNIKFLAVIAHAIFLAVYGLLVTALLWHYRRYSLPGDKARWIIGAFLLFAFIFAAISTVLLFLIPWDKIINY
ncbi:MAG: hypothetical protein AAB527_00855 [Patescibacteria group bacterium]